MSTWSRHLVIYEINTWGWLSSMGSRIGRPIHLGSVPATEWDAIAKFGFEAVWLMGVWERSHVRSGDSARGTRPGRDAADSGFCAEPRCA